MFAYAEAGDDGAPAFISNIEAGFVIEGTPTPEPPGAWLLGSGLGLLVLLGLLRVR